MASLLRMPEAEAAKLSKRQAGYQETPHGDQRCGACMHFQPPHACEVVAGHIDPEDWRRYFHPKT